ncbi:MAG: TIM barrel protein [Planctomycetaceae bacterium]|jgi:hydroxypyruvate isomerase|nr:TIM barrel protein [Planctomycetaceae bacterium]
MKRRSFMKTVAGIAGVTILGAAGKSIFAQTAEQIEALTVKGNIRQSVSKWCFGQIPLDEFCKICKKLGMVGVDLINEKDWDTVNKNNMIVTMGNGAGGIPDGFNRIENHEKLIAGYARIIPIAADKGVPNIICFSGNRKGMDDELGLENCAIGLKKLMPTAEKYKVNLVMELLSSKNHKDYMADTTPWGGALARKVGSERFKLLYDIFHMQRMEGDIIQMIRDYKDVIGHYHTGGNPGRNDIDETQEIYYPAVMKAILETGYKGFVAHEFLPKDGLNSLRKGVQICDV